jgi:hypothetical protein
MRRVSIAFLFVALGLQVSGLWSSSQNYQTTARDYADIMAYVQRAEKEGFRKEDFDKFALDRKMVQKRVFVGPVLAWDCHALALVALVVSLTLSLLHRPKP